MRPLRTSFCSICIVLGALLDEGGVTGDTEHSKVVVSHRNYEDLGWKDT